MQLCDKEIIRAIAEEKLLFVGTDSKYPFQEEQIQPASIDLRLGNRIVRFKEDVPIFDIKNRATINELLKDEFVEEGKEIRIEPGEIIFGEIYEQIYISDCFSARIEGRSRVARLGVSVHCTGDYINPGFEGAMPLQIINHNHFPIILYPYIDICQMIVYQLTDTPLILYKDRPDSKYHRELHASASILSADTSGSFDSGIDKERIRRMIEKHYRKQLEVSPTNKAEIKQKIASATESSIQTMITINNSNSTHSGPEIGGDQYNAHQAGTQGPYSGINAGINQNINECSEEIVSQILADLKQIKAYVRSMPQSDENDIIIGDVAKAERAISQKDNNKVCEILKSCGKALLGFAKEVGCQVLAQYICMVTGIK